MNLDIIGDIHGCFEEFKKLTECLNYEWVNNIPLHPDRKLAFVGDITDRGPQSLALIEVVYSIVIEQRNGYYVPGNHCNKLYRYFLGNKVQVKHGLETTVAEYESLNKKEQQSIREKFIQLYEASPLYHVLDNGRLVIAHAGIKEELIGKQGERVKTFVLYGDITGKTHEDGTPVRLDWAMKYSGKAVIVYGHTPVKEPRIIHNTYNIDTGAVFGGNLTSLRYPEMETYSVPSSMPYVEEKFKPFV